MNPRTLYDKHIDSHTVCRLDDQGHVLLYIDRQVINEYTSPQAFSGLRAAGRKVWRPGTALAVVDHVNPTTPQRVAAMPDAGGARQVSYLAENCRDFGIELLDILDKRQGIEHVIAPEQGFILPGSRQTAYFTGRGAPALGKLAGDADAVIGVRSLWADDPLYPIARRSNIRIVEVDAARPVDGALPGIAVQPGLKVDGLNSQPWLASNNMGRMADVIAADLVRLAPSAKPKIEANLAALKQRLLKLSADSEARLAEVDNLSVLSLSDHFGYLIGSLNLELIGQDPRPDAEWTTEDLKKLTSTLKDNDVAVVLHHRQPSEAVKAAIAASGSHLLVLSTDAEDPVAELEGNVDLLLKGLSGGPSA